MQRESITIVGGCGRVGLPLGLLMASHGHTVMLYDINAEAVKAVNAGTMPHRESGADLLLTTGLAIGTLAASTEPSYVAESTVVILAVGAGGRGDHDDVAACLGAVDAIAEYLKERTLVIIRSTMHPGGVDRVHEHLRMHGFTGPVAFCPERIAEGRALTELTSLPQIVAAYGGDPWTETRTVALFSTMDIKTVPLTVAEAEVAKLFTNLWRYVKFAAANQMWSVCDKAGIDLGRVAAAMRFDYPRCDDLPTAGFTGGPCLPKDSLLLDDVLGMTLGRLAANINWSLPRYVATRAASRHPKFTTVGLLGMAYKPGSDDSRGSLAYHVREAFTQSGYLILATDPYVPDPTLVPYEEVIERAELLVITCPHPQYRGVRERIGDTPLIDISGYTGGPTGI